jgi:hypothetical protein
MPGDRLGPGEGFIGVRYLRLYPIDQIVPPDTEYVDAVHPNFGSFITAF